jgi:aminocarboxymuconate-semialdehyde decarboxylase
MRVSAPQQHPVDHIMSVPISDKDKIAILGGNAAKLFGVKGNGVG